MQRLLSVPIILLAAAGVAAFIGCSGDGPTAIEIPLATVEITSPCPDIEEGGTCQMAARGITADGQVVTNAVLRWSSSNGSVVQVNDEGRLFAVGTGKATVTVEAALGSGSDSAEVFVRPVFPKP